MYVQKPSRFAYFELLALTILIAYACSFLLAGLFDHEYINNFIVTNIESHGTRRLSTTVFFMLFSITLAASVYAIRKDNTILEKLTQYAYLILFLTTPFCFPYAILNQTLYTLNTISVFVFAICFFFYKCRKVFDSFTPTLNVHYFRYALITLILLYTAYFGYITIYRHTNFLSGAYDLGIYAQVFNSLSIGEGSWQTVNYNGEFNEHTYYAFRMTHFSPFYYLLTPIYKIYPHVETMLVLQSLFLALAVAPLAKITLLKTKNKWLALVLSLSFLLNPALQHANWFDFHELKFMPFFLLYALYYLEKGKFWKYVLFMGLTATIKEDLSIIGFLGGIYYWYKNGNARLSLASSVLFIAYYFIVTRFIMVFTLEDKLFDGFKTENNNGIAGLLTTIVSNPFFTLNQFFSNIDKVIYWYKQLQIVSFLPLFSPDTLFIMISSSLVSIFSNWEATYQIGFQYALYPLPFLYYSTIISISRFFNKKYIPLAIFILAFLGITHNKLYGKLMSPKEISSLETNAEIKKVMHEFLSCIPDSSSVSASHSLIPHMYKRKFLYMLPTIKNAEYIFVQHKAGDIWPTPAHEVIQNVRNLVNSGEYGIYRFYDRDLFILKKGYKGMLPPVNELLDNYYWKSVSLPKNVGVNLIDQGRYVRAINPGMGRGCLIYGPYTELGQGKYVLELEIKAVEFDKSQPILKYNIVSNVTDFITNGIITSQHFTKEGYNKISIPIESVNYKDKVEFRIEYTGNGKIFIDHYQLIKKE